MCAVEADGRQLLLGLSQCELNPVKVRTRDKITCST
jgi:hypothetical protein